ncbi:hypothetical protein, partial [Staphylococcus pseudintermedius]|uniref:hypothetical protein n=2 Tax=Staphylococcus pseudintermedius TaxID=283734 RepID=UPI0019D459E3
INVLLLMELYSLLMKTSTKNEHKLDKKLMLLFSRFHKLALSFAVFHIILPRRLRCLMECILLTVAASL